MSSVRPALKPETPKAVTAWDLRTGRTVYWTADGRWSENAADAAALTGEAGDAAMAEAKTRITEIADPYFMEVAPDGAIAGRETIRETIRARGPTSHPDLGRQGGSP